jgi:hypothetical protein
MLDEPYSDVGLARRADEKSSPSVEIGTASVDLALFCRFLRYQTNTAPRVNKQLRSYLSKYDDDEPVYIVQRTL